MAKWVQPATAAQIAPQFSTLRMLHMPTPTEPPKYHPFVLEWDVLVWYAVSREGYAAASVSTEKSARPQSVLPALQQTPLPTKPELQGVAGGRGGEDGGRGAMGGAGGKGGDRSATT